MISRASVDERRGYILDALRSLGSVSFRELAGQTFDEMVATFLAVLYLFRRGLIHVTQSSLYGAILIDTPPAA